MLCYHRYGDRTSDMPGCLQVIPICSPFNANSPMQDFLADRLLLDAIVTVVDAKHIEQHLDDKKPDGIENEVFFFPDYCPQFP